MRSSNDRVFSKLKAKFVKFTDYISSVKISVDIIQLEKCYWTD